MARIYSSKSENVVDNGNTRHTIYLSEDEVELLRSGIKARHLSPGQRITLELECDPPDERIRFQITKTT